jgi:two-component system response regulator AlgR
MLTEGAGRHRPQRKAPEPAPPAGRRAPCPPCRDGEINALLLRSSCGSATVTEVSDGDSALAAARSARFGAILLDIHLPGQDGLAIARAIRGRWGPADPPHRRHPDAGENRVAATEAGFDRFLQKPVTPEALSQALTGSENSIAAA